MMSQQANHSKKAIQPGMLMDERKDKYAWNDMMKALEMCEKRGEWL